MKKYLVGMAVLLCCAFVVVAAQVEFNLGATRDGSLQKPPPLPRTTEDIDFMGPGEVRQGGEDCGSATPITLLSFEASGTTIGYTHEYDEVCPYTGSLAPDVVYSFTPATDVIVNASLCTPGTNTDYDTKLFVYENTCPDGGPFACNDDACSSPSADFVSEITGLALTAGNTYYFVVDGYGGGSGNYTLAITEVPTCDCPGGEVPEGEPNCGNPDTYNGGCNQTTPYDPATFTTVTCNTTYCGTTGADGTTRDTDWYLLNMPQVDNVHVTLTAAYPMFIFNLDVGDCSAPSVTLDVAVDACVPGTLDFTSVVGDNYIWIGPQNFDGVPCPTDYIMEITCDVVPVELQTFGIE